RISSLRPPAPATPSSIPPGALVLEGFDEGSIAFAFDALVSEDRASLPGTHEFDLAPVRELFSELAANHMRHVRDFMIDVKWGEVTRDWIHICVPPVRTLRKAAERLELTSLGASLEKLGDELDAANAVGGQMLDANEKQRLLDAYGELVEILPQAFALDRDKTQREAVIVQALLLQVPDVRKVTIDKLHAAGLTSLTELFEANAHDIAHVAGIPHALASRIVERVQSYRAELKSSSPQDARAAEREKLAGLNGQLKQHHDAYEEAANAWGPEAKAKKRDHFRAREETWLEISVLLARFGEVDRLQGIEKVPFAQRIAQLSDYLEEARDKYRSPEG
ncbi:MAG: helix-hairpin-helix domain-containing protein, partial [Labilithrix sp.]|nr:helix-hairpin-helix domain-containing protein [Labilithrix sp.]